MTVSEEIELSSGVILTLTPGAPLALNNVMNEMNQSDPPPKPPDVWSEDKERNEPNPNDPDYKKAMAERDSNWSMKIFTLLLATSSTVKDIPDGMMTPESDDFLEMMEMAGIVPRRTPTGRYVQWVQMVAILKDDTKLLNIQLLRLTGLSEDDIAEAEATFRDLTESDTDQESRRAVNGQDRDRVSEPDSRVSA
ncbi:hypothetical protein LCGC14_0353680 [marine sediment metagenome]|uniref:Uncharacterized protein n=1 Tax=marine sediment metagenome TaxID=412755 RepID=A0A0F9VXF2_9ZZZZ